MSCSDVIVVEISDLTIRGSEQEIQMIFFSQSQYYLLVCNSLYLLSPSYNISVLFTLEIKLEDVPFMKIETIISWHSWFSENLHPKIDFFLSPTQNKNKCISL